MTTILISKYGMEMSINRTSHCFVRPSFNNIAMLRKALVLRGFEEHDVCILERYNVNLDPLPTKTMRIELSYTGNLKNFSVKEGDAIKVIRSNMFQAHEGSPSILCHTSIS